MVADGVAGHRGNFFYMLYFQDNKVEVKALERKVVKGYISNWPITLALLRRNMLRH